MADDVRVARTVPNGSTATQFQAGNHGAVTHGLRTDRVPPEYEHLVAEVKEFTDAALVDEGDLGTVSRRRLGLLEYRARVHRRILQLDTALERHSLFDRRGKLRVAWLQQLQGLISTAKALDSLLGLQKRQKRIPTAAELLREGE